jgi:hypothetical protein
MPAASEIPVTLIAAPPPHTAASGLAHMMARRLRRRVYSGRRKMRKEGKSIHVAHKKWATRFYSGRPEVTVTVWLKPHHEYCDHGATNASTPTSNRHAFASPCSSSNSLLVECQGTVRRLLTAPRHEKPLVGGSDSAAIAYVFKKRNSRARRGCSVVDPLAKREVGGVVTGFPDRRRLPLAPP